MNFFKCLKYSLIFFFILINKNSFSLDQKEILKIENYLNGFNKLSSNFIQSSSDGNQAEGSLHLSRPGKMRIEYKKKDNLLIVADGKWLHYYDIELNEKQSIIIEKSPAWFLLKKKINLKKDFKIEKLENQKGRTSLILSNKNMENVKYIKLIFSNTPFVLKKWIIHDINSLETTVSLLNIKKMNKFSPKTFTLNK